MAKVIVDTNVIMPYMGDNADVALKRLAKKINEKEPVKQKTITGVLASLGIPRINTIVEAEKKQTDKLIKDSSKVDDVDQILKNVRESIKEQEQAKADEDSKKQKKSAENALTAYQQLQEKDLAFREKELAFAKQKEDNAKLAKSLDAQQKALDRIRQFESNISYDTPNQAAVLNRQIEREQRELEESKRKAKENRERIEEAKKNLEAIRSRIYAQPAPVVPKEMLGPRSLRSRVDTETNLRSRVVRKAYKPIQGPGWFREPPRHSDAARKGQRSRRVRRLKRSKLNIQKVRKPRRPMRRRRN